MKIIPLAYTQYSFDALSTLKINNPIRILDELRMSKDNPLAFATILAKLKGCKYIKANSYGCLNHTFCSFIICAPLRELYMLGVAIGTYIVGAVEDSDETVAIASGTLAEWQRAVLDGCHPDLPVGHRQLFNKIYLYFRSVDMASFIGSETKNLNDGTFTIL